MLIVLGPLHTKFSNLISFNYLTKSGILTGKSGLKLAAKRHKVTQSHSKLSDLPPHCDVGSMSRRFWVSQIMTDLSELLLIMIRAGISLLPQCQTLSRSLITQSQRRGSWAWHHMLRFTIQSEILWDNNVTITVMSAMSLSLCRSQSVSFCHKTQTFSRYKQNFREKADFCDINYLSCVCLPAASLVSPVSVGQHPKAVMFSSRWSHIVELKT